MMRRLRPNRWPLALIVLAAIPARLALAQCAMCGSAAGSSPGVARGLAYSIFFLLGMLALTVGWLLLLLLRVQRARAAGEKRNAEGLSPETGPAMHDTPAGDAPGIP